MIYPQTGAAAQVGQNMVNASKFALEEIGYEIAGRKIEAIIEDDATKPEVAIDKARKLIENDKVDLIMGPLVTSCVEATAPYISKAGIPQLVASPSDLKMSQYEWHIMVGGSKQQMVSPMGLYSFEKLGFKNVATMTEDTVSGRSFLDAFTAPIKNKGGKVVQEQYPPQGCPDYAPYFTSLKDADACVAWFQSSDAIRFLSQYNEFGIRKRMPLQAAHFGSFVQPFLLNRLPPAVSEAMIGEHMMSLYTYLIDTPAAKKFDDAWVKKFGDHPDDVQATPYITTETMIRALRATNGDTTPDKLRQAILALDFESCEGRISFDAKTRCAIRDTFVCKIDKVGKLYTAVPEFTYKQVPPGGL